MLVCLTFFTYSFRRELEEVKEGRHNLGVFLTRAFLSLLHHTFIILQLNMFCYLTSDRVFEIILFGCA